MRLLVLAFTLLAAVAPTRPRARDAGLVIGTLPTGANNAITDVAGVRVGQTSVIRGENVRTGVTVILPHGGNLFREKVAGAVFVGNGFGKLMGSTQVEELGEIESPIALTSTLNVPRVADALLDYMLALPGNEDVRSINVVVGETNDGKLNDIRGRHVGRNEVFAAIKDAKDGPVEEGSVGAGVGTVAFGWKGGIGTSSRRVLGGWTVGVLVQTNYGGTLGRSIRKGDDGKGSIMIVIATDAPVDARNLKRMGMRAMFGLARTGSSGSNGSGDYAIAFSTARNATTLVKNDDMSPLFVATIDATEEAIYNSLLKATDVKDVKAIPVEDLLKAWSGGL
ncbi:MAG TPA: P1 family peptidase [Thermoanaerobaculia bacterium]|nr:P1 family peptidase [Thermoanaerobaculia bacterium]